MLIYCIVEKRNSLATHIFTPKLQLWTFPLALPYIYLMTSVIRESTAMDTGKLNSSFGRIHACYQKLQLNAHLPHVIACSENVECAAGERFHPQDGFIYFLLSGKSPSQSTTLITCWGL